ncbi:MAG: hypothetical protein ACM31L_13845 [Actinomycetota bacterium]
MTRVHVYMTFALGAFAMLAGCTYRGGDIGDPAVRKFDWFSFVAGDDIREHCQPDMPDRFRMVYNAIYTEQLRIYEWDSLRRVLSVKVRGETMGGGLALDDPLAPWRAKSEKVQLDGPTYDRLVAALQADGAFGPPAVGLQLPSRSYYWTAATCRAGRYAFTAWRHPSEAFDRLQAPALLFALDFTGEPVRQAAPVPFDPFFNDKVRKNQAVDFNLGVGENGLSSRP